MKYLDEVEFGGAHHDAVRTTTCELLWYGVSEGGEVVLAVDDGHDGIEIKISMEQWYQIAAARASADRTARGPRSRRMARPLARG